MTIVVARKFGERIILHSDTAIENRTSTRLNSIPGRLKAVVLALNVSVAYSGAADRASAMIRPARDKLRASGYAAMLDYLAEGSLQRSPQWDDSIDFLVAAHVPKAELRRIKRGIVSSPLDGAWIGDSDLVRQFSEAEIEAANPTPNGEIPEPEHQFSAAFRQLFYSFDGPRSELRLGLPINLLGSPFGHCYQDTATSMAWDTITLGLGITPEQEEDRRTGATQFQCSLYSARYRGVAVVGAAIHQARIGFVYAPTLSPEPFKLPLWPSDQDWTGHVHKMDQVLMNELDRVAEVVGGGVLIE